jgi:AbiV family abortive infection protein
MPNTATVEGFPSDEQIAVGLNLCFLNADSLRIEAQLLYDNGFKARAFALAVLALEELAKIPLLFNGLKLRRILGADPRQFWREIRRHTHKHGVWTAYGSILAAANDRDAQYFNEKLPPDLGNSLDEAKQRCIYTEFRAEHFEDPTGFEAANPGLWPWLIRLLDNRLTPFRHLHGELALSQFAVANYVRMLDPTKRTVYDNQHIARMKALGIDWP